MKRIVLAALTFISIANSYAQQQSQIQAKRGIFTDWLYVKDKWINHVSTDLNSTDSLNDNALVTSKAVYDFVKLNTPDSVQAGNGLSMNNGVIQLGQAPGDPDNPAILNGDLEVPMDNHTISFKTGNVRSENGAYYSDLRPGSLWVKTSGDNTPAYLGFSENDSQAQFQIDLTGIAGYTPDPRRSRIVGIYPLEINHPVVKVPYMATGGSLPSATGTQRVMVTDDNGTLLKNSNSVDLSLRPYKSYVALLTQTGTSAPTTTVLESTLTGSITWARTGVGTYTATFPFGFVTNKTWIVCHPSSGTGNILISNLSWTSQSVLTLVTKDQTLANADGFDKISVEIRVYP